ncbi:F-box protein At3g54460 isoform X2 [Corylus avellana]|uniref:F-box protein At3g54460 isoform X2 n=1 Tax=Corylus avellana TaxID=13451 RepID=UPI00286C4A20|nr:F-box protein At3g54460 isoform X2 [Corylus avellana]
MDDDDSFLDHKLCGYLCAVLAVNLPPPLRPEKLRFNTRCEIFGDGSEVGFRSHNGVVLSVVSGSEQCEGAGVVADKRRRKVRKIGQVRGSISVVHQLHALVTHRCVKVNARVVWVGGGDVEVRAVVLVDVYVPIVAWSGWQFPRSGGIAGALFRHLSCDWGERKSMLARGEYFIEAHGADESIWNLSDCHVIGCKLHYNATDSSKRRLFELHEIFKSLPSVMKERQPDSSRIIPINESYKSGVWDVSDDILIKILATLGPMDLYRVAATCRHLRSLAALVMPCMKLKLFSHQQAAVQWMLQRERNAEILPHPLFSALSTEDGFSFYVNVVSGEIVTEIPPTIKDFRGGMFCDEPGLGKTITALSLILKTQGTLADPPEGVQVIWCTHNGDQRCGYYELSGDNISGGNMFVDNKDVGQNAQRGMEDLNHSSTKRARLIVFDEQIAGFDESSTSKGKKSPISACSEPAMSMVRRSRDLGRIKKNLFSPYEGETVFPKERKLGKNSSKRKHTSVDPEHCSQEKQVGGLYGVLNGCKRPGGAAADNLEYNDTWVQCDACRKWRKLGETRVADASAAWFCGMNPDFLYQSCSVPEESWDNCSRIRYLPGFYSQRTSRGEEQNVSFFTSVLREHYHLINYESKKALTWLAKLPLNRLSQMESIGLQSPYLGTPVVPVGNAHGFYKIFQAFGLIKREVKGICRWYYPRDLDNLVFDVAALRIALCVPLDSVRLYLSRATLIVVPANLVDHWKTQIEKHVSPRQLRVFVWTDHRKPAVHSLAWDYDIVITTFNRLSAEWDPRKKSVLVQVHWLRVILDEGHSLGSSVSLTNKLQLAVSLVASNRWILTGTPTPNTPNSQLSHFHPLLKFLHEEAFGQNQKSWEAGILRPFEAGMEEGRSRLLHLLHKCMISARKMDLHSIPPCIKKVTFLNFTEEHARSYNELVVTVRRNILMADWNDPSHVESLLNPKQWKFRSATVRNVRLSCCVAGHIKVTEAGEDIQETMDVLVEKGLDPTSEEYAHIKSHLLCGGNCVRCQEWCRLPAITPCRHLLCLDCVALDSEKCTYPGCGNLYEMETPDVLTRAENPNPKWPVPKDLIELQPSYKQDNWDPDWQSTSSSKVTYLVQKLNALLEGNREVGYCIGEGKSHMSDAKLLLLDNFSRTSTNTEKLSPEKVIIFSQFLEHIHVIEQQLTIAGIKFAGMYSPMHSSNKMKALTTFQNDPSCIALLMDGSAALGLDLSFVTRVFLMEPIWDKRH